MLGAGHDVTDDAFDVAADRSRPVADALRRPLGVEPVMRRHMFLLGRIPQAAAGFGAEVEGDPDVVVEVTIQVEKPSNGKCYEHVFGRVTGEDQAFDGLGTKGFPFSAISIASNALNPCLRAVEM